MRMIYVHRLFGVAALGVCFMVGQEPPVSAALSPASPATEAPPDMADELPVLFDYRQVVAAQDISGLREGTHVVEVDVYAPSHVGWTARSERQVTAGVQVLHVDSQAPAATRVTFQPLNNQANARRVRVEMDLTEPGSWVVMLGNGLQAAHAEPELLARYGVRDPESLKAAGDYEFLHPGLMLRTVGSCNHVTKVSTEADDSGILRAVRLHFSEALDPASTASAPRMDLKDPDGRHRASITAQSARVTGNVAELRVPVVREARGALEISLEHVPGFAGRFRDQLSCAEEEGSVGVGYFFGEQSSGEHVVSPLQQAAARALGEDRK